MRATIIACALAALLPCCAQARDKPTASDVPGPMGGMPPVYGLPDGGDGGYGGGGGSSRVGRGGDGGGGGGGGSAAYGEGAGGGAAAHGRGRQAKPRGGRGLAGSPDDSLLGTYGGRGGAGGRGGGSY